MNNQNYWGKVLASLNFDKTGYDIQMEYLIVCDPTFVTYQFDWSLIIVITVTSIVIYIMALNGTIYSINVQFVGYKVMWWYGLFYPGIALLMGAAMWVGISTTVQYNIILGVIFPICILTSFFYVNELLCLLPDRANIKRPINILFFRVVDVISMLLSTFLVSAWWLLNKPWYLNDIICFFMTGTFMKLLKITSLKQGFIFLTIIFITDVLSMTIALNFLTNQSVDSLVEDQYNVPIMFEVQEFHMYLYKLCAWIVRALNQLILPPLPFSLSLAPPRFRIFPPPPPLLGLLSPSASLALREVLAVFK